MRFYLVIIFLFPLSVSLYGQRDHSKHGGSEEIRHYPNAEMIAFNRGFNDGLRNKVKSSDHYSEAFQKNAYASGYATAATIRNKGVHWYVNSGVKSELIADLRGLKVNQAIKVLKERGFIEGKSFTQAHLIYSNWYNPGTLQCITTIVQKGHISEILITSGCEDL